MRYTMDTKYLGVTYDRTKAMDIPEEQFKYVRKQMDSFAPYDSSTTTDKLTFMCSCFIHQELKRN